jgi:hypothetical protein
MRIARWSLLLVGMLLLTWLIYRPGLNGNYTFDDYPNIVENIALHVTTLDPDAWLRAMWSSPSSEFQRPLASLSIALNHYFSGLDPWPMKATNLLIHLLNGVLLYALLRRIAAALRTGTADILSASETCSRDGCAPVSHVPVAGQWQRGDWLALFVTTAWLLHPINLTAVLYVVQRMESLAQLFVLLGLLLYLDARQRQSEGRGGSMLRLWIGVPLCTLLGLAAKESAVLLPLFALILELVMFRGWLQRRTELAAYFSIFLFIPAFWACAGYSPEH